MNKWIDVVTQPFGFTATGDPVTPEVVTEIRNELNDLEIELMQGTNNPEGLAYNLLEVYVQQLINTLSQMKDNGLEFKNSEVADFVRGEVMKGLKVLESENRG